MSQKKFVIVGGGLTGLCLAHYLHKQNQQVILLEASDRLGGRYRSDATELAFIPPSESAVSALEWLKTISPTGVTWTESDHQPLYHESYEWKNFLGFGDFPSTVVNELAFFNQNRQIVMEPGFDHVTRAL